MNEAYLNLIAEAGRAAVTHVSLASGVAEGNEIAGITRQAITWSAAASGNLDSSNQPVFSVTGGTTVSHVQFWSAATGGTFYGSAPITQETFAGDGTYTLTDVDILHNAS